MKRKKEIGFLLCLTCLWSLPLAEASTIFAVLGLLFPAAALFTLYCIIMDTLDERDQDD